MHTLRSFPDWLNREFWGRGLAVCMQSSPPDVLQLRSYSLLQSDRGCKTEKVCEGVHAKWQLLSRWPAPLMWFWPLLFLPVLSSVCRSPEWQWQADTLSYLPRPLFTLSTWVSQIEHFRTALKLCWLSAICKVRPAAQRGVQSPPRSYFHPPPLHVECGHMTQQALRSCLHHWGS